MRERKPPRKTTEKKQTQYFDISPSPPNAEKKPTFSQIHGEDRLDDYAWLAATNWREALQGSDT